LGKGRQTVWAEDRVDIVEELNDGDDAEDESAPLHRLEQYVW